MSIPQGLIIIWSGFSGNIPLGWFLCDGTNNTPDLRDRFVIGAGNVFNFDITGGSKDSIIPSHTHTVVSVNSGGNHSHSFPATTSTTYQQANAARLNRGSVGVTTVTAPFGFYGGTSTHAHSASGVGTTGSSGTNANLPPYFALFYIMKGGE